MERLNIFIVEDESIVAKDIQNSLTKLGYNVVGTANNGVDAIDKITTLKPDLILMDIMIKGSMTGIEVSERVREKMNIPVIFLTAYADEGTLARAKITQPYGYILKPFKEIDLHSTIEMAVYKHEKDSALLKERDFLYSLVDNKEERGDNVLFVKSGSKIIKLMLNEVIYIEAQKDYVVINTTTNKFTVHISMTKISQKLNDHFIRIHRSYIARLDKIESIDNQTVLLENRKAVLPVGKLYKDDLRRRLKML